jgi:hypothetical protein
MLTQHLPFSARVRLVFSKGAESEYLRLENGIFYLSRIVQVFPPSELNQFWLSDVLT